MRIYTSNCSISKENPGIYKVNPNISWEIITHNIISRHNKRPLQDISAMERYLNNGLRPSGVTNTDTMKLGYKYLASTDFTDTIYQELGNLISDMTDMLNRGSNSRGNNLITNTRSWRAIAPHILNNMSLKFSFLEAFYPERYNIIWINTALHENVIKFFTLASHIVNKYDDNTYEFTCLPYEGYRGSKVLLLSNPKNIATSKCYTKEQLDKYFYKFFVGTEEDYCENFSSKDYKIEDMSVKEKELQKLLSETLSYTLINDLISIDNSIKRYYDSYCKAIKDREFLAQDLSNQINTVKDAQIFIDTLEKMSSTIQWSVHDDNLLLAVTTPLFNYDEDLIKRMFTNNIIHKDFATNTTWVYKFLKACFIDNKFEIMTKTHVLIDLRHYKVMNHSNRYFTTMNFYSTEQMSEYFKRYSSEEFIPNPHIARFNCFGQNGPVLTQLIKNKQWEELIYCIQATMANINFNDNTVFSALICWLNTCPKHVKIARDTNRKKFLTIEQVRSLFEDEENQNNTSV